MTDKNRIIKTAEKMIAENGLINLSRRELCLRAGISDGSFIHVMGITFTDFIKTFDDDNKTRKVNKNRVSPDLRRENILNIAVDVAIDIGYHKLTREVVAETAGVSMGLVSKYFGTMPRLKRDVMRFAIKNKIPQIVAQGLAIQDKHAVKAPQELKNAAAEIIANL